MVNELSPSKGSHDAEASSTDSSPTLLAHNHALKHRKVKF